MKLRQALPFNYHVSRAVDTSHSDLYESGNLGFPMYGPQFMNVYQFHCEAGLVNEEVRTNAFIRLLARQN